jgi:hypothetical protein
MVAEISLLGRALDTIIGAKSPQEIMEFKATKAEESRLDYLSEKRDADTLSQDEKEEYDTFFLAEHFIQLAKSRAYAQLNSN